ncbi:SIS domain-containing protein [Streptomyces europaeiscabiei]|uniref:SIS domain-containing protein n=1 Tax=Streptomyces europaeiscabiei TaxID=146819 RepID=A0ABU4NV43_9ACTN|nr:SIS domain-containing protein [Streptomyces europaeiscabiei]MDX2759457.1 SIS domain-containing protein [Streptomyces europaeiscabiei]MDX2766894.1 SIS domain-containing protein [Streptomyces europaeiscabiei]MDX3549057.1 SIS domain-containing protein [Streptomyces europaeiscabiei]MDX3558275.1 SIS domain-containing protein [Streptomyces europaeiscabiei]MDX3667353.1 SIS domain-containing protein [Streptomyces europaeiscabiei]
MSRTEIEIATQPECWRRAIELARRPDDPACAAMPRPGERVAVVGCGTSWFMAHAYAVLRESAGHGETDAFPASEMPAGRAYDRVVALTRSGTTSEVLELLGRMRGRTPTVAVTADPATPVMDVADAAVVLDFADETSVVQTRFATTELVLLRALLGEDLGHLAAQAASALVEPLPEELLDAEQFTFLGRGWAYGIAQEAALKMREAAGAWTEAYPVMEYRHGPISITGPGRVAWWFGDPTAVPDGLPEEIARTGGQLVALGRDPVADLVVVQRLAVALGGARGLDPDNPRHLTRSVILT